MGLYIQLTKMMEKNGCYTYKDNAMAYVLSKWDNEKNNYAKTTIQQAYWKLQDKSYNPKDENAETLYNEAKAYESLMNSNQNFTVDTTEASLVGSKYGPIKITYSYETYGNAEFGGFDYCFFDDKGEIIKDGCALHLGETLVGQKKDSDDGWYQVRRADFNEKDLYIKIDLEKAKNLTKITMKVKPNVQKITAKVTLLAGSYNRTKGYYYCEDCLSKVDELPYDATDDSKLDEDKMDGIIKNKRKIKISNQIYEYNRTATINSQGQYYKYKIGSYPYNFCNADKKNSWYCENCSMTISENEPGHGGHEITKTTNYSGTQYIFKNSEGCDEQCGWLTENTEAHSQDLFILTEYTVEDDETMEEVSFYLIPSVTLQLQKYNSYYATTNKLLKEAVFTVEAKQDGEEIYKKEISTVNGKLNIIINPTSRNPIYVKITETKAPAGYDEIDPIYVKLEIKGNNWAVSIGKPESTDDDIVEELKTEFKNVFGQDSYVYWPYWDENDENGTNLPNKYKSEKNSDIIELSQGNDSEDSGNKYTIKVYNEPKIEIKLTKVDNIDNTITLKGARFSGTIENIKSLKWKGKTYSPNEGKINFTGLETDEKGNLVVTLKNIELYDEEKPIIINITEVKAPESNTENWYYEELANPITIKIDFTKDEGITNVSWSNNENKENVQVILTGEKVIEIEVPNIRLIKIEGKVWLDGNTGIKPVIGPNGKIDTNEAGIPNVEVRLYNGSTIEETTKTDANGQYNFKDITYGPQYSIQFVYDGINYEDTEYYKNVTDETGNIIGHSKAQENETNREAFNEKFKIIKKEQAQNSSFKDTVSLEYITTENKESTLNTHNGENGTLNVNDFGMTAEVQEDDLKISENCTVCSKNINFGLIKRGTDLALSTDLVTAKVTINGKEAQYQYNEASNNIEIGSKQTYENNVRYNLNLWSSDYNYRIRDYVSNSSFTKVDNTGDGTIKTGDELKVYAIYQIKLQNQSTKDARIYEIKYTPDQRYTYNEELTVAYNSENNGITHMQSSKVENENSILINLDGAVIGGLATQNENTSKILYLVFEVDIKDLTGEFTNTAEITKYGTDEGLIDVDSAPGNYEDGMQEDDSDKSGGLTIKVNTETPRTIEGKVFDKTGNNDVNGVIVQLIEIKENEDDEKYYEYIWQETTSGNKQVMKMNDAGTNIETYETDITGAGKYKFEGYIPANYIVRFIYGDGSSYDEYGSKYNGQDYKSVEDAKYQEEWYDKDNYKEEDSIARDNEARRLETMAYSVNVDGEKGTLLKLLDIQNVENLNKVEKSLVIEAYNNCYPEEKISEITDELLTKLLKEQVLENTWMCAETSKINVTVDDGDTNSYNNMNFGLEERPQTKIELKKYITGFKLVASNGQTLVNAVVDVEEYFKNPGSISEKIQGIRDNSVVTDTFWSYEVSPIELSTILEGANLEFVYDLIVENHSDADYLSAELINAYKNKSIEDYEKYLIKTASDVKEKIKTGTHTNGTYLGNAYYTGKTDTNKVQTEVTSLKDYVNDNLRLIGVNLTEDKYEETTEKHYVLNDAYGLDEKEVKTLILKGTSKKLISGEKTYMSQVTLGKDSISTSGILEVDTYIAEVIAYTNSAGRRADTTPANAEFVSRGIDGNQARTHEKDEADTARIQIGSATGEDEKTPYVWLIVITVGIAIIGVGTIVTKKYIMK